MSSVRDGGEARHGYRLSLWVGLRSAGFPSFQAHET